jgi:hypothetical protein
MNNDNVKILFWALLDIFIAVAVVGMIFFVMPMLSKWENSFAPTRTMTVSAEGKTTATPDLAELSFSVVSQGKNPADLDASNNDKMSAVIEFVKSQGIDSKDITTTAYDLSPNYRYDLNTNRNYITGYTLTQTVSVKVRDLTKVASVIGGLTPLGVNQIGGVNFTFVDTEKFLAVARADALSKVKTKAIAMAAGADVSLGEVVNVGENIVYQVPYAETRNSVATMSAGAAAPTIEPGTQDVTDNVAVTYELK